MGGAQPLAATMNDGVCLGVEIDPTRIRPPARDALPRRAGATTSTTRSARARRTREAARAVDRPRSATLRRSARDPRAPLERQEQGDGPRDLVTDQTSAHDPLVGYIPQGTSLDDGERERTEDPDAYVRQRSRESMAARSRRCSRCRRRAPRSSTTATTIRARPAGRLRRGPSTSPASCRRTSVPLFCEGKGPFRWVALSGDPEDIDVTDQAIRSCSRPTRSRIRPPARWIELAAERVQFQGLPARICWLGYGDRAKVGLAFNELVRTGKVKAPIVIGRDHLDCGSVASPNRETEAMKDGVRRRRRLGDPQRARQHRVRRDLGVLPPRRRRRHRLLAARRHGRRRRRHGPRGGEASSAC